jgi:endonuclease/exonuclease/phosphatase family metal-dependent hydrolase
MQDGPTLKVVTLNLAHGRKDAWHQALLARATIRANLDEVVKILLHERPDVVALQEADAASLWSGRFDHVAYLAEKTGIRYFLLGKHVRRMKLAYGTALLSRHRLREATSHRFSPSLPTQRKGMVIGIIHWPGRPEVAIDLVSVHLDFSRKSVRRRQACEIIDRLAERRRPLVLMGDFNCGFGAKDTTLQLLAQELNLQAHEPEATDMVSFPLRNKRFDWIMISPELAFGEYRTLPDVLSDHRAVVATLRLNRLS